MESTPLTFLKNWPKTYIKKIAGFERKLKHFKKHYENYVYNIDYKVCKQQLHAIKEKAKGIKIRSKCNWYVHGEKSTTFS